MGLHRISKGPNAGLFKFKTRTMRFHAKSREKAVAQIAAAMIKYKRMGTYSKQKATGHKAHRSTYEKYKEKLHPIVAVKHYPKLHIGQAPTMLKKKVIHVPKLGFGPVTKKIVAVKHYPKLHIGQAPAMLRKVTKRKLVSVPILHSRKRRRVTKMGHLKIS